MEAMSRKRLLSRSNAKKKGGMMFAHTSGPTSSRTFKEEKSRLSKIWHQAGRKMAKESHFKSASSAFKVADTAGKHIDKRVSFGKADRKKSFLSGWYGPTRKNGTGAHELFETFRGKPVSTRSQGTAANGTPKTLAQLGKLREIQLPGRRLTWPNGSKARLGGRNNRLHIVNATLGYRSNHSGQEVDLGPILSITYEADKPHIEEGTYNYKHRFEGTRPHLVIDEESRPVIEGGSYTITADGIEG